MFTTGFKNCGTGVGEKEIYATKDPPWLVATLKQDRFTTCFKTCGTGSLCKNVFKK